MKIRVITNRYEYMGLLQNSCHNIEATTVNSWGSREYYFNHMGRNWVLTEFDCEEVFPAPNEKLLDVINTDLKREECRSSYCECEEGKCSGGKVDMRADEARKIMEKGPIKSDGGSSSYYDLELPAWLLYTLNERQKEGKCYIKTEEMIAAFFGNDFSFGTLLKSLVRAWGIKIGAGKAGNDMKYETGKIRYYADKILEQNEEKK